MPLYFAYGSNMDVEAMSVRCPRSRPIGPGFMAGYRFVLMGISGYASLRADRSATVHGMLFQLGFRDVGALDRYEDVAGGLYSKAILPVHTRNGAGSRRALVYLGKDMTENGKPPLGYMETILAAAHSAELPAAHIDTLRALAPAVAAPRSAWQA